MKPSSLLAAGLLAVAGVSFLLGVVWARPPLPLDAAGPAIPLRGVELPATPAPDPDLQGREPPAPPAGRNRTTAPPTNPAPVVYGGDDTRGMSADGMIAVTGSYGVGTSVLYLIDTRRRQLAVYEARGGTNSMRRIHLVGARNIDLDLRLEGYNDESEYSYQELRKLFERRGLTDGVGPTTPAPAPAAPEPGRTGEEKR